MPTPESLARAFQRDIEQGSIEAVRQMTEALARALPGLTQQATDAAARVAALRAAGRNAEAATYSAQRARAIAQQVEAEVRRLVHLITPAMLNGQQAAVRAGLAAAEQLTAASLPEGLTLDVLARFGRPWQPANLQAAQALVGATGPGSPLDRLMNQIAPDTGRRVRETLTSGLLAGKNPRVTARALRREVGLPAKRAETIARTETLRAYRAASTATYRANPDIVKGFKRLAAKNARTCPMCLALDGEQQDTDQLMAVHPNDRCAVVPVTASFRDLGIPVDEVPRPERESGAAWFGRQPAETQRAILGPGGLAVYQRGAGLKDFVRVYDDSTWGPTLRRATLAEVA